MIKFDSNSIYNRALARLQQSSDWSVISNNSVIDALLRSNAEVNSETARYAEYLFKESKWDTAQNESSILAMANMLGYQPKRRISASGNIRVSIDPNTQYIGKTISSGIFDSGSNISWGVPSSKITIDSSCSIVDENGVSYVASPMSTSLDAHNKYVDITIIQGIKKSSYIDITTIRNTCTQSKLDPYLYIPIYIENCENASTTLSKSFFRVYVIRSLGETIEPTEYRVVSNSLFSSTSDLDVEVYNDMYSRNLFYLKFNNDSLRGSTLDISENTSIKGIKIDYLESLGSKGNITKLFRNFTLTGLKNENNNLINTKLYGVNYNAFVNGKDEESVTEIKANAPKYYISNYTSGTKEAYENTILNLEFPIGSKNVSPTKVRVYAGTKTNADTGITKDVTKVTFIADGLDDIDVEDSNDSIYSKVDSALSYYLDKLKAPQDSLEFVPPTYVPFTIGVKCKVDKEEVQDMSALVNNIRNLIDTNWGADSNELNFDRNFYPSSLEKLIMNNYKEIKSIDITVEAIKKISWSNQGIVRINPKENANSQSIAALQNHTMRIPFSFNNLFLGNKNIKGFKDYRVGAEYVMRVDFIYKSPINYSYSTNYNTSIFINDTKGSRNSSFYLKHELNSTSIWDTEFTTNSSSDYSSLLNNITQLNESYQYYLRDKVYDDNDYIGLVNDTKNNYISTISDHTVTPGCIDDYLIYFSGNIDESKETIGEGWIEITFDPIYKILETFASYDSSLSEKLSECSLSNLKCGNDADVGSTFEKFKEICKEYLDIYVSLRPNDSSLILSNENDDYKNGVLYVDTSDVSTGVTNSINNVKRNRMISVECSYEE